MHQNFDLFIVFLKELGYTDADIMKRCDIPKQRIYDARNRLETLLQALKNIDDPKSVVYGNPDVSRIVEAFKTNFGTTKTTKYDRWAANRLAKKHGAENIVTVIAALASLRENKYAPAINSVDQLEIKWVSAGQFLNKQSGQEIIKL